MVPLPTLTAESLLLFGGQKAQTTLSYFMVFTYRSPFKYCVLVDGFLPGKKEGLLSAKLILEVVCTSVILRV